MKNLLLLLVLFCVACNANGQGKKKTKVIGFGAHVSTPVYVSKNANIRHIKLGLPTFSYQASLENRFSIHNKLNFSLQYSLQYSIRNFTRLAETNHYLKNQNQNIAAGIQVSNLSKVAKQCSLKTGLGFTQAITRHDSFVYGNETLSSKSKIFDAKNFNPYLIIGIENSTRIFNRNLYYSIEYNLGFFPFSQQMKALDNASPAFNQGFIIGLKYKY